MSLWAVNLSVTDQCGVDAHLAATGTLPLAGRAFKWGWSCNTHTHTHITCMQTHTSHTHARTHTHTHTHTEFYFGSVAQ